MVSTKDLTDCIVVPGTGTVVDFLHPATGRTLYGGQTLAQVRERYPTAVVTTYDAWQAARAAEQDAPKFWEETTQERYHEMLDVLPPAAMVGLAFLVGEPADHHAVTGEARFSAFKLEGGRYYTLSGPVTKRQFLDYVGVK